MEKKATISIILTATICCGIMALVDGVIQPGYGIKSAIKIMLFLLLPFLLSRLNKEVAFGELFHFRRKGFLVALALGASLYILIVSAYLLLALVVDFSSIVDALSENAGVNRRNFLFVALYICFINSLLEEFFFRGFLFTNLKKTASRGLAYCFSALLFALYHVAMMVGWFQLPLLILVITGLIVGGMIFNFLNENQDTIYVSWLVHMFVNFSINTIGFLLMENM